MKIALKQLRAQVKIRDKMVNFKYFVDINMAYYNA